MASREELKNNSNYHFKRMMKRNRREEIIQLLEKEKLGLNVTQIRTRLDISRNTVKNHLATLEREGKIQVTEFGRSKVVFLNPKLDLTTNTVSTENQDNKLTQKFTKSLLKALDEIEREAKDNSGTNLSRLIGKHMEPFFTIPSLWDSLEKPINPTNEKIFFFLKSVGKQLPSIISRIWSPTSIEFIPQAQGVDDSLIVRFEVSGAPWAESLFHILEGLFEAKMKKLLGVEITTRLLELNKDEGRAYIEITLGGNNHGGK